ncbi:TldD/PmbA family protein [Sporosalibacterium faouarense]|uniref:TldD/PmbA family protein n=1 Tax=Sporosalibacterium faouarense TaxID=516123 RepID=UPI00311CCA09
MLKNHNLKVHSDLFKQYTELRVQENRELNISLIKGNLVRNTKKSTGGVSVRVNNKGYWGFSSIPSFNSDGIKKSIEQASYNANFLQSKENKTKSTFQPSNPSFEMDLTTKKTKFTQKQIMEYIKEVDSYIVNKYPKLSNREVHMQCLDMEKKILTSDGASLFSMLPRSIVYIALILEKNGEPVRITVPFGGLGQFEDNFDSPRNLYEEIDKTYNHLLKKAEAIYAEAGVKECILDAKLAGILAHEAIGHTVEADLVLGGSVAGDYLGKKVASPLISLVDYANEYDGKMCPVPVYIDDEGTDAKDVVIIEDGVLKSFMHNKESAQHFNVSPTGNARAYQYFDEPLIRMRNTAIVPGKSSIDEMISSIEDGYYLIQPSNGQADTTSEFMFGVTLGYEIKNGKIGRAIKDTTISGIAFDVLESVSMVSDEMNWSAGGFCGKKQMITVGMGGPAIKSKINLGGR